MRKRRLRLLLAVLLLSVFKRAQGAADGRRNAGHGHAAEPDGAWPGRDGTVCRQARRKKNELIQTIKASILGLPQKEICGSPLF